jgi:hypothetical protein
MIAPPTVGTETYISFADADALAVDRLNAGEWRAAVAEYLAELNRSYDPEAGDPPPPSLDEAIPAVCRQALTTATATLDRLAWAGSLATAQQPLSWPRTGLSVPADPTPRALATACAELAFHLLTPEGQQRRGVQMQMIGQAMETYFPEVADELPKHVRLLIEPFLRVGSAHNAELIP